MPSLPLHFVNPNGCDALETSVSQTPGNSVFYRLIDLVPANVKRLRDFLPGHTFGPASKKPFIFCRYRTLAVSPRNMFDLDAASWAVHTPHAIQEIDGNAPKWHEFKSPRFRHGVITRTDSSAARTRTKSISSGKDLHFNCWSHRIFQPGYFSENKRLVTCHTIEDSFKLHPVDPGSCCGKYANSPITEPPQDANPS